MEATAKSRTAAREGCQPALPWVLGECGKLLLKAGAGNQPVPLRVAGCWDGGVPGDSGECGMDLCAAPPGTGDSCGDTKHLGVKSLREEISADVPYHFLRSGPSFLSLE